MYGACVYSRKSQRDVRVGQGDQPNSEHLRTNHDPDNDWIANAVAPFARRRRVGAQLRLFAEGDVASSYYFVETGELLAHRRLARPTTGGPTAAVRFLTSGDLFILNCGELHAADCDALVDCVVLSIDRVQLQQQAALDPDLSHAQSAVHADELRFILRSLRPNQTIVENHLGCTEFDAAAVE